MRSWLSAPGRSPATHRYGVCAGRKHRGTDGGTCPLRSGTTGCRLRAGRDAVGAGAEAWYAQDHHLHVMPAAGRRPGGRGRRSVNRGETWALPEGRNALIISLAGPLEEAYGAVCDRAARQRLLPDTAMSVVIGDPLPRTAVAASMSPRYASTASTAQGSSARSTPRPRPAWTPLCAQSRTCNQLCSPGPLHKPGASTGVKTDIVMHDAVTADSASFTRHPNPSRGSRPHGTRDSAAPSAGTPPYSPPSRVCCRTASSHFVFAPLYERPQGAGAVAGVWNATGRFDDISGTLSGPARMIRPPGSWADALAVTAGATSPREPSRALGVLAAADTPSPKKAITDHARPTVQRHACPRRAPVCGAGGPRQVRLGQEQAERRQVHSGHGRRGACAVVQPGTARELRRHHPCPPIGADQAPGRRACDRGPRRRRPPGPGRPDRRPGGDTPTSQVEKTLRTGTRRCTNGSARHTPHDGSGSSAASPT